jgi:F-type H+-transporting ATPase subunit delta
MPNPRLASRYAKSLLDLAVEQNSLDATLQDMQLLDRICQHSHDFTSMLRSPIIHTDKKHHIIDAVLGSNIHTLTRTFMALLVNKGRESNLPEIAQAFIEQYNAMKNIKSVKLTTAVAIDEKVKESIMAKVMKNLSNDSIQLKTEVNPSLIGGFVLEMEDKLFDASISKHLHDFKNAVQDNSYISQLR